MKYAVINKDNLGKWLADLKKKARVYAPKKKENLFVFRPVKDISEVSLKYIPTILPPKKYYFPQREKLFKFSVNPFKTGKAIKEFEEFILFAVHTCDIAGIQCMDVVFRDSPEDPNYLNRKDKMTIIGIECLEYCDKFANCAAMGNHEPRGGYDLMMVDIGDNFILHINSDKGEKLVKGLSYIKEAVNADMESLDRVREEKKKIFKPEFNAQLPKVYDAFDKSFASDVWKDVGKRCVGCGNCTAVCPTCYCFDVMDQMELSLKEGVRSRMWNSCQMDDFAKVAGGEDFRKGRDARQRHRYYRKFKYSVDKYNRYFCTGCGRCTRTCMADIKLIETVNSLTETIQ
ncbi:MAG: 4Fe-4S dicluster domain-containing protein [Candidatus Omnitrophica bacterium]|nr:4Fe-4S dicluster domain-containing protein [Candidatus Omnitrophota bacterium]